MERVDAKFCVNCFKIKPTSEFYKRKAGDGFQSRCKECNTEVCRGYRDRARDRVFIETEEDFRVFRNSRCNSFQGAAVREYFDQFKKNESLPLPRGR